MKKVCVLSLINWFGSFFKLWGEVSMGRFICLSVDRSVCNSVTGLTQPMLTNFKMFTVHNLTIVYWQRKGNCLNMLPVNMEIKKCKIYDLKRYAISSYHTLLMSNVACHCEIVAALCILNKDDIEKKHQQAWAELSQAQP